MTFRWAGPALALVTFAAIAIGHLLVRRLHASFGTRPALPLFLLGAMVLAASLLTPGDLPSSLLGIIAITLIWDGVEIYRQEMRVNRDA
jgi:hypothetical protein